MTTPTQTPVRPPSRTTRRTWIAVAVAVALVAASMLFPVITGEDVRVHAPPLHADWGPDVGWHTLLPLTVGVALLLTWRYLVERLPWPAFLGASYAMAWLWPFSLAISLGREGFARLYERPGEYLHDAVRVQDVGVMMHEFVERIPYTHPDNWHVHVAGHPPGALLFYIGLDRVGIDDPFWVGVVVMTLGATAVVAGTLCVRVLAGETWARRVAPWLVLAPLAIWMSQGDALFMAAAAWGLALLAVAATRGSARSRAAWGVGAGLVLGLCVYLSYGLVLLGVLALAVLFLARRWSVLPWALLGALVVAAVFTVAGFSWWEAYPVLVERYNAGIASERSYHYWVWANLAAWTFSVGLVTWAALPEVFAAVRRREPVAVLAAAGFATIVVATVSGMSKAEVERIWMPFSLFVLMGCAYLPARWRMPALATNVLLGLAIQSLYVIPVLALARSPQ
ncbi:MAG: hypothetical protein Q7T56_01975 [Nocardioidaceae bacterium]|nr:hypothetical protein [Nocardioidaceae bacterium]